MFYFYLIIKIIAYYSLPLYLFQKRNFHNKLFSIQSFLLFAWLVYLAYLSYLPFIDYYYTNELNVQFIIPNYAVFILPVLFAPMPLLYYLFFTVLVSKVKILTIVTGLLFLLISSMIIFGIEIFNHQKTNSHRIRKIFCTIWSNHKFLNSQTIISMCSTINYIHKWKR